MKIEYPEYAQQISNSAKDFSYINDQGKKIPKYFRISPIDLLAFANSVRSRRTSHAATEEFEC